MKKYFALSIILVSISAFAEHNTRSGRPIVDSKGNRVDCSNVIEGEHVGGKFETKLAFDSSIPSLVSVTTITLSGKPPVTKKTNYLSAKSVCGLDLDFSKDCQFKERLGNLGYDFTFTCGHEITSAEIYCDENCVATGSEASFRCEGPKVDKKMAGVGLVFQGCKYTKNNS